MEEVAANESLTEETRASAKKALDELASSQVLEVGNTALKKTHSAALEKLELEAEFTRRQVQAERHKAEAEREKAGMDGETDVGELLGALYVPLQDGLEELGVEAVDDLKELEAEDVEQLTAKLKKVQAKKFAKKMAALQDE